jgi:flagellar protein FliS
MSDTSARAYLENAVLTASPVRLVVMLYDHALLKLRTARVAIESRDPKVSGPAINAASAVLSELQGSLDHEAGGEIAASLASIYRFALSELAQANLRMQAERIDGVIRVLTPLRDAWDQLARRAA